jgi:uncharacterized membrane protein
MRKEAWDAVVRTKWLWRLAWIFMILNLVLQLAMSMIGGAFVEMGIPTWMEFAKAKFAAAQQGLTYAVPSLSAALQMTGASAFETFIAYIFSAIFYLGFACVTCKAVCNNEEKWFSGAFEGFRRPLDAAWLLFLMNLKVALWSLLFLVPGIVAAYRYRQAWYLKAGNPDWSASKCIRESCRMMNGFKWKAFVFDFSFAGWFLLVGAIVAVSLAAHIVLAGVLAPVLVLFVLCYFFAGRAVFYRRLAEEREETL